MFGFDVTAITEYQGKLVAGGSFLTAGGDTVRNIAIWDGVNWSALGEGLCNGGSNYCNSLANTASVYDLFADGNDLYVAGNFIYAGNIICNGIARWDGAGWHNYGIGAYENSMAQSVYDVYESNGELYSIGGFNNSYSLVKWDGMNWNSYYAEEIYGGGTGDLVFYNHEFYVGGGFVTDTNGQVLNFIARRSTFDLENDSATCYGSCIGTSNAPELGAQPDTYLWSNGETTQSVSNLCTGINSVTVTDSTGSISTGSIEIYSPPAITVTDTSVNASCASCNNGTVSITATGGTPPLSYEWSNGETTSEVDSLVVGTYYITVTDGNGCVAVDTIMMDFDNGIHSHTTSYLRFTISPNPVVDKLIINCPLSNSEIEITDVTARKILNFEFKDSMLKAEIDLSDLASGVYFISANTVDGTVVRKFVKD